MRLIKPYMRNGIKVSALLCTLLLLCTVLSACAENKSDPGNDDRVLVVSTIFPSYDFARNVAGEYADVQLLVDVTDSHSYSPTAMDMVTIEECDVFIYTGGEGDLWAEDFLSTIDCTDKIIINMLETVDFLLEESDESHHDHEHDHHHEHEHDDRHEDKPIYDEHVWLSLNNAAQITSAISDALCNLDPANTESYRVNTERYCAELSALSVEFAALVETAEHKTILVADRFPYRYLCEEYGLSYFAALPGCSSASDLTAVEYEALAETLRNENLPVIFMAEYSDGTIARTVKRESAREDLPILTLHSCHTMTIGQINDGNSYLSLMRKNLDALKIALS